MTKDQFIEGLRLGVIYIDLAYNHFLEKGGKLTMQEFSQGVSMGLVNLEMYFAEYFSIPLLYSKEGKFLKIIF